MIKNENNKKAQSKPDTYTVLPAVFCHKCGREVKLTKDGRYRRRGYKRSYGSRDILGYPLHSGYKGVEHKRPCWASGEFPLP